MITKKFLGGGLKVVIAVLGGLAAFAGIGYILADEKQKPVSGGTEGETNGTPQSPTRQEQCVQEDDRRGQRIMDGLRVTQDKAGKFVNVVQSLTMVVDSVLRMFDRSKPAAVGGGFYQMANPGQPQYYIGPGYNMINNPYNNPWVQNPGMGMQQPMTMNGTGQATWNRVDENIVEAR